MIKWRAEEREVTPAVRECLAKWYGSDAVAKIRYAESFEICEYGARPNEEQLRVLFPFLPPKK
jgi:hypothetical protein